MKRNLLVLTIGFLVGSYAQAEFTKSRLKKILPLLQTGIYEVAEKSVRNDLSDDEVAELLKETTENIRAALNIRKEF